VQIAILTYLYPEMINYAYKLLPNLHEQSYIDQKKVIDNHISIWASGWEKALEEKNIPVLTIPTNIPQFIKKWAEENNFPHSERIQIIIEMLKRFLPDVLFYDLYDDDLLEKIKATVPSIKLIALWKGSPPVDMKIFKHVDVTISCAPEEVTNLNKIGIKAEHLNHAFNKNILALQNQFNKKFDVVFIGQIYRAIGFHINRDKVLKEIVKEMELRIFSSAYELGVSDFLYHIAKRTTLILLLPFYYSLNQFTGKYSSEIEKAKKYSFFPYSLKLKNSLQPAVYGKEMYNVIKSSKVILNIHADSSPRYASNMRLFETTGVGSCLLTDWKENINELFKEDEEVVTYRNAKECVDKAKWLLDHDSERELIAKKGQQRTFSSHLYEHRVPEFLDIIKKHLK
jgi:spore maturation protein CgeB